MIRISLISASLLATALGAQQLAEWHRADPAYEWTFPADHGPHSGYKTEWWYFTGLVQAPAELEASFGYQFTIFRIGVVPETPESPSSWATSNVFMGHLALTDLASGKHRFSEVLYRASPPLPEFGPPDSTLIAWSLAPPGTQGRWELRRTDQGFELAGVGAGVSLELTTETEAPPVFQGPGGYSRKSHAPNRASMYYSYPRLNTTGTITVGEEGPRSVVGTSWMDHEFSSDPLEEEQVGWDWFSIRLDDGRSVMAFQLRGQDQSPGYRHLTLIDQNGVPAYLAEDEWSLTPGALWFSEATEASYPVAWTLRIPGSGLDLQIRATSNTQENVSARLDKLFYWEGAIGVESSPGQRIGEGYLEMTGYGEGSRPAL